MNSDSTRPDTIVLIHGFWVTPRSWENWIARYEARGYRVLAPAYPGFEVEVEALNADPSPIEALTVPAVVEHLEAVVGGLESPPILIGHSAGGTFVQILLDHGFGASGVAINSAPTEGVLREPALTNQVAVPGPHETGQIFYEAGFANFHLNPPTEVHFKNQDRRRGEGPHGAGFARQEAVREVRALAGEDGVVDFEGRPHLLMAAEGWEEVAASIDSWLDGVLDVTPVEAKSAPA